MNCKDIKELLVDYYYGEIDSSVKEGISTHLKDCAVCSKSWNDLKKTLDTVYLEEPEMPKEFWNNYRARVHEKINESQTVRMPAMLRPSYRAAFGIIFVAVIALIGVYQINETEDEKTFISSNYELIENMDMLDELDILQYLDEIEAIEET